MHGRCIWNRLEWRGGEGRGLRLRRSSGDGRGGIQASESVIDADTVRLPMLYLHKPGGCLDLVEVRGTDC